MAYTRQQRLGAYNIYLETGSMTEVVKRTKIAEKTLFRWKKEEDWDELIKQFKIKVRAKLEERGLDKLIVKDEDLLRVIRILFQLTYTALRATVEDDEGNTIQNPNRVIPTSISDINAILTKVTTLQSEVLGRQVEEELPQKEYTEEEVKLINKILLKGRTYDADEDRRKAAEEFRNRNSSTAKK